MTIEQYKAQAKALRANIRNLKRTIEILGDIPEPMINAFGSPNFNVIPVMEQLHQAHKETGDGSILTLMNVLPHLVEISKKLY